MKTVSENKITDELSKSDLCAIGAAQRVCRNNGRFEIIINIGLMLYGVSNLLIEYNSPEGMGVWVLVVFIAVSNLARLKTDRLIVRLAKKVGIDDPAIPYPRHTLLQVLMMVILGLLVAGAVWALCMLFL